MADVTETVDACLTWAKAHGLDVNSDSLRTLLLAHRDELLADNPADWHAEDVDLLFAGEEEEPPVFAGDSVPQAVVAARVLFQFLADADRFTERSDPVTELLDALNDVEATPETPDADMSIEEFIAAKRARLQDTPWTDDDVNWLPDSDAEEDDEEQRAASALFREAFGLGETLPPLRLPSDEELAVGARDCPPLARARTLAEWSGDHRKVDGDGDLTVEDAVAAAMAAGIKVPETAPGSGEPALPGMPATPPISTIDDLPELVHLWSLALDAGFLSLIGPDDAITHAVSGDALAEWPNGDDEQVLEVWFEAFGSILGHSLVLDFDLDPDGGGDLELTALGAILIVLLAQVRDEIDRDEIAELFERAATAEMPPLPARKAWRSWVTAHGHPADVLTARMAEVGAVERTDDGARLTPLGLWAARKLLGQYGVVIPLLPPVEEMTADDLVAEFAGPMLEEEMEAETSAWLALRPPDQAARELAAVAMAGGPQERMLATATMLKIGSAAEPAWREVVGEPTLRPYAKLALAQLSDNEPPTGMTPEPEDAAWMLLDILATQLADPFAEDDELIEELQDAVPAGQEAALFDVMWRLPHPSAADALTAIGESHPDKVVAKAARKAAFKAKTHRNEH